ncbi:hypothetical protein HYDPIDRAFT_117844 [Hydnomerulius pinastri MD-312]|uniref:G domain-containing protein n=1 Tax=Hydnomerulius pinastri MD-312 TaxID=994086 RepID=A0A0C9W9I0_9AGAM|nr:hypothetical protein HYDPIDRAFT_117844 [Hydnomerulius pinastri MD-312]
MHLLPSIFRERPTPSIINNLLKNLAADNTDKDIFNIVIIGQTGTGTSSLINLLTGTPSAPTSSSVRPCTKIFTSYALTIGRRSFRLIDAPGFGTHAASMRALTRSLHLLDARFGIDLIVHCLRSSAPANAHNYAALRGAVPDVPIVAAVTGLERYPGASMEEWWTHNEAALKTRRMVFAGHACVAAGVAGDRKIRARLGESEKAVKELILRHCFLRRESCEVRSLKRHEHW